jgi:chromosomal replication initiator protein
MTMDAKQIWQRALEKLRLRVSPAAYAIWCHSSISHSPQDNRVTVSIPVPMLDDLERRRFQEQARIAISEVIGEHADVILMTAAPPSPPAPGVLPHPERTARPSDTFIPALRSRHGGEGARGQTRRPEVAQRVALAYSPRTKTGRRDGKRAPAQPPLPLVGIQTDSEHQKELSLARPRMVDQRSQELQPRYCFETYVVGTANQLAFAAAQEVARHPGEQYNPLLISGAPGLGKTHLLQAIGHVTEQRGLSVAYVTAEQFTNEIVEAIRQHTTDGFRTRYRAVDILLVDDVQFIAGKESTEEEFFHTFNTLHEAGKQIVLSSDRVPQAMSHLHDRLRSRFQWGLIADLDTPSFTLRLAILHAKAATLPIPIPDEVLLYLARPEDQNIRALEGSLNRVVAYAQILGQPLDARMVASTLAPLAAEPVDQSPGEIVAAVARHFSVSEPSLMGKSRERAIVWARQVAMYLLRQETPASLFQIGQQLGGRDHTTVLHGCQRVDQALCRSELARADIAAIRSALRR